jgi:hypothetical protein
MTPKLEPSTDPSYGRKKDKPLLSHSIDGQRAILGRLLHDATGQLLVAHRFGSMLALDRERFAKPVDCYEVATLDGSHRERLFLYMYAEVSKIPPQPPQGYRYHYGPLPDLPEPRIVNHRLRDFPAAVGVGGVGGKLAWDEDSLAAMTDEELADWEGPIEPSER